MSLALARARERRAARLLHKAELVAAKAKTLIQRRKAKVRVAKLGRAYTVASNKLDVVLRRRFHY